MTEGDARSGSIGCDLGPEDAQPCCARGWMRLTSASSERDLLALLQSDGFSHADLDRRARRVHERRLEPAVARAHRRRPAQIAAAAQDVFTACFAAIPYAPAAAFLGAREGASCDPRPRAGPRRARRRRHRRHARRDAHDRRDPRARRARLRGRGGRHRPPRRPPPDARSPRSTIPYYAGLQGRRARACPPSSTRWPRAGTTSCTRARRARPASRPR